MPVKRRCSKILTELGKRTRTVRILEYEYIGKR